MTQKRVTLSLKKHKQRVGKGNTSITPAAQQAVKVQAPIEDNQSITPPVLVSRVDVPVVQPIQVEPIAHWHCVHEAAVGMSHRKMKPAVPCQDACYASVQPRLALFVCDGAGSSKVSEIGSNSLVQSLNRLTFSLEGMLAHYLDKPNDGQFAGQLADLFYRYSVHHALDLANTHKRSDKDFRSTLLMAIAGKHHAFWLKVGDGQLVVEEGDLGCRSIGHADKGEFANQTVFIDGSLSFDSVQFGVLDASKLTGIALMSDGSAERLVSVDGLQVATRVSAWMAQLRQSKLGAEQLFQFFNEAEVWQGSTHDDKSIAMAAR